VNDIEEFLEAEETPKISENAKFISALEDDT